MWNYATEQLGKVASLACDNLEWLAKIAAVVGGAGYAGWKSAAFLAQVDPPSGIPWDLFGDLSLGGAISFVGWYLLNEKKKSDTALLERMDKRDAEHRVDMATERDKCEVRIGNLCKEAIEEKRQLAPILKENTTVLSQCLLVITEAKEGKEAK